MYVLTLGHVPNPDIRGGYWEQPVDDGAPKKKHLNTLAECVEAAAEYIERNHLGGGNWADRTHNCGRITKDGEVVAWVSYNGRLFSGPIPDWRNIHEMLAHREFDPATGEPIPGQEIV